MWVSDSGGAPGRALLRTGMDGTTGGQRLLSLLDGSVQGWVQLPGLSWDAQRGRGLGSSRLSAHPRGWRQLPAPPVASAALTG